MKEHSREELEQAFKVINDNVYKLYAEMALNGNIKAVKLLAEREEKLRKDKLRKELFGF